MCIKTQMNFENSGSLHLHLRLYPVDLLVNLCQPHNLLYCQPRQSARKLSIIVINDVQRWKINLSQPCRHPSSAHVGPISLNSVDLIETHWLNCQPHRPDFPLDCQLSQSNYQSRQSARQPHQIFVNLVEPDCKTPLTSSTWLVGSVSITIQQI